MIRRDFLRNTLGLLLLFPFRKVVYAEPTYQMGDVAPEKSSPEVSGNLNLKTENLLNPQPSYTFSGEGHTHLITLNERAWSLFRRSGKVVVRSGPGGKDFHSHWILVKVAS